MINKSLFPSYYLSLINKYTMDINTKPIIINVTTPTKGFAGKHHSDASKAKISRSKKGVSNLKNRKCDKSRILEDRKTMNVTELAAKYNVSRKTIYRYLN